MSILRKGGGGGYVASIIVFLMSLGFMSHINFNKSLCRPVKFRGQGPLVTFSIFSSQGPVSPPVPPVLAAATAEGILSCIHMFAYKFSQNLYLLTFVLMFHGPNREPNYLQFKGNINLRNRNQRFFNYVPSGICVKRCIHSPN